MNPANMTDDQKRIAIAEFMGWTKGPDGEDVNTHGEAASLPDYPNSKDALAPVLEKLSRKQQRKLNTFLEESFEYT